MTWKQSAQRNHNVCMMSAFNMRRSVSAAEINVNKNALLIIDVKNDNKQKIICVCVCVCVMFVSQMFVGKCHAIHFPLFLSSP